jgi:diguanylate cyclase (GGDEF)-like protein/PAS domain S-box-containing protein
MAYILSSYKIILVIFSIMIAIIASYTAFDQYLRMQSTLKRYNKLLLMSSSMVLGIGIWCTHHISILAFIPIHQTNINMFYVYLSLLFALTGSFMTFFVLNKFKNVFFSSFLISLVVVGTHFIAMMALKQDVLMHFKLVYLLLAILFGSLSGYLSINGVRGITEKMTMNVKVKSGLLMGITILGIHYISMHAEIMIPERPSTYIPGYSVDMMQLSVGIGIATFVLLILVLFGSLIVEKMSGHAVKIQTNEQYYQSLYLNNPDLVLTFDVEGNFQSANDIIKFYGYTEEELLNKPFAPYIVPEKLELSLAYFKKAVSGITTNYETTVYGKNGDIYELNVTNIPIFVGDNIVGVYGILKDITDHKNAMRSLAEAEEKYRRLAEDSLIGIYIIQNEKLVYVNNTLIKMFGYSEQEIYEQDVMEMVHPDDRQLVAGNINTKLLNELPGVPYRYRAIKKDQTTIYLEAHGNYMTYMGEPAVFGAVIDITTKKQAEDMIQHMAYHDHLTGLHNRYHLSKQFDLSKKKPEFTNAAVLLMDLDKFKLVNDALGHEIGNRLLQAVGQRLKELMAGLGEVVRNDGDEFLIYLPQMDKEQVISVTEMIIEHFTMPFQIDQYDLFITPSIGVSQYPKHGEHIEDLIKKADIAMLEAKKNGKNNYQFYNHSQSDNSFERLELETSLHKAIENEEFKLLYQPKVNLTTGKIIGAEALIRWEHPEKGLISPAKFIPLAEEIGLIIPISEWVLRTACYQAKAWQEAGLAPIVMSVNLSMVQLYQPNLVDTIKNVLDETALDPKYLELELTESIMVDSDHTVKVLRKIKKLGVKISLDDFGTGFSSLHYLKELPIDIIKIDQSFVLKSITDANDATIVKTIIAMAHQLKLDVIAEGVETKEHLIFLQKNLCNDAQGYFFSRPVSEKEFVSQFSTIEQMVIQYGLPKDVQEQKWMENALEVARLELIDTIRQQQGMTFKFIKENGKFIHTLCDGELLYQMGFVPENVIGKELSEFVPPETAERKGGYYRRAWAGEVVSYEGVENDICYLAVLRPIYKGGQVVEVIGSCVDITKRKHFEESLKLSEAKNRIIVENTSDLILILDDNGIIQYASPSHEGLLDLDITLMHGKPLLEYIEPKRREWTQEKFEEMLQTKTPFQYEFSYKLDNGYILYFDTKWIPILDENNDIEQIIVASRDITEKKRTEEFIQRSEKLSVVGQLAAGVAHEIRNPLTAIKGFLQMAEQEKDELKYTDIMLSEINRIEDIIKEFLALSKQQVKKVSKVNSQTLLQNVITLFSTQAVLNNVEIIQEFDEDLPDIDCDQNQMKQVFFNILQNAVEAMTNSGVIRIQVAQLNEDYVRFRFIDQGAGISLERLRKIGEPFYSTKEKGTGLGLMISHKIIQEHEGTIQIDSVVDQGTTVEVLLPIHRKSELLGHGIQST